MEQITVTRSIETLPTLVLNADYLPLSKYPLSTWGWQDTIKAVLKDAVAVVAEHDAFVRSPSLELKLPSIVALREYVPVMRTPAFTRHNILLRDRSSCGYCGHKFEARELTYDHIVPRAQGGRTTWLNIVMACMPCNGKKGARTPSGAGMTLLWRPWEPTFDELARIAGRISEENLYNGWRDFLYWDEPLDR